MLTRLFLCYLCAMLVASCSLNGDDPAGPVIQQPQTLSLINTLPEYSKLTVALRRTGLDSVLTNAALYTLMAPNDAAFARSGVDVTTADSAELTNVLLYHILANTVFSRTSAQPGQFYLNTANTQGPGNSSLPFFVEQTTTNIRLNNAADLIDEELVGNNGLIQPISEVLVPPSVLDLVRQNPVLSEFDSLLSIASTSTEGDSLRRQLDDAEALTLFVPLDGDFPDDLDTTNTTTVLNVLGYHTVAGRTDLFPNFPSSMTTQQGDAIVFNGREIITTGAQLITIQLENINATNGRVHLIDRLMRPEGF